MIFVYREERGRERDRLGDRVATKIVGSSPYSLTLPARGFFVSSRIGMLHGLPTIRQFIWIWKRSSASLRIRYLEFYLPLYSMGLLAPPPPSLSLFLPAVLFNPLFLSFLSRVPVGLRAALLLAPRGSLCRASARFYLAFRDCIVPHGWIGNPL